MCMSTLYMDVDGKLTQVMEQVARLEARDDGYVVADLFGDETFVQGRLVRLDFVGDNAIVIKSV